MYTSRKSKNYLWSLLLCMLFFSCSNIGFELPQGPQGTSGQSAYKVWKNEVKAGHINWPSEKTEVTDFLFYLKGDKGNDGLSAYEQWKNLIAKGNVPNPHSPSQMWPSSQNTESDFWNFLSGKDGQTPYIGSNGNWWINQTDTGVKSIGKDGINGKEGTSAYELWKQLVEKREIDWPKDQTTQNDFFLSLKGQNGVTPHIGSNGNWHIGSTDTGVSAKGQDGNAGASAYELWKKDVEAGQITDKNGQKWPAGKTSAEDFYTYLSGSNGKSAYELWKEMVAKGNIEDPKTPSQQWPAEKISERDFFSYLTGKDGVNGHDGLSAYEVWKNDLAQRCSTPDAILNPQDGKAWDCDKNTLDDFYTYLRGKDGKDGEDGKPGEPGAPGAEVTIVKGVPNVIAQYSQSEFGEYVRTTDGGVLYKVYDEQGQLAPRAVVKGMPGIDSKKTYTANHQGEFIVPKEDLPEIQDLNMRWGTVKSVTIEGKEPKVSAKNTYVPNRIHLRVVLEGCNLNSYQTLYYLVQRKINPDDEWQNLPSYLPYSSSRYMEAYRVSDKNNPKSILKDQKLICNSRHTPSTNGGYRYNSSTYRPVKENPMAYKNGYSQYWDEKEIYYTLKAYEPYYGEIIQWNGVCLLAPFQMGPVLKKLKLRNMSKEKEPAFVSAEGELDFSMIDFTRIYKSINKKEVKENGMDYVTPIAYSENEARQLKLAYLLFKFNSSAGSQNASSSGNPSSANSPTFKVYSPFLNSEIHIVTTSGNFFSTFKLGYIERGKEPNTFIVRKDKSSYKINDVEVTYEE